MKRILSNRKRLAAWGAGLLCAVAMAPAALEAQSVVLAAAAHTLFGGFSNAQGVAVDQKGAFYVADTYNNQILKETPSGTGYTQSVVANQGLSFPFNVQVDSAGDVFFTDAGNGRIVEETPANGSYSESVVASGLNGPEGLAIDASGNLYVAEVDTGHIYKETLANGTYTQSTIFGGGYGQVFGVAVDSAGNVYAADTGYNQIMEFMWNGTSYSGPSNILSANSPEHLVVDGSGNIYFEQTPASRLMKATYAGGTYTTSLVADGFGVVSQIALEPNGNIVLADEANEQVDEVNFSAAPFASTNVCPSGQTSPSPCSQSAILNYAVNADATLGTPLAVTQGVQNMDFSIASSSCTGSVSAGSTCMVNVTFAPKFPGIRTGAVEILDGSGNVVTTTNIYGVGNGPQAVFGVGAQSTLLGGLSGSNGVAVDSAGNVYVAATDAGNVYKVTPGGTSSTVASGFGYPYGLAVDGAGNLYVTNLHNSPDVIKIAPNGSQTSVGSGWSEPAGVAVDGAGNVYVSDWGNNSVTKVALNGTQTSVGGGYNTPMGLAVDGAGDVFVATYFSGVFEVTPAGVQTSVGGGWRTPTYVAVDAAGDAFVTDANAGTLTEVAANGTQTTLAEIGFPYGVGLDSAGDLFVASINGALVEVPRPQAPSLTFEATGYNTTSSDSPQSVTIQNIGNAALTMSGLSVASNFAQVDGSGTPEDCTASASLAPGTECNLSLSFTPESVGVISGQAVLSDNALNGNPATQTIQLNGTGQVGTATIALGNTNQIYTGIASPVTAATSPSGLGVSITYNGSTTVPTAVGSYTVAAAINDPNYQGTATGTLVISKATASIALGNTSQTYTGAASAVTATTTPSGLSVSLTYNGSTTIPTAVGSYPVIATINDPNYQGSQSGTLVIGKATATITLGSTSQTYNGSAHSVTATTAPAGLAVVITYNGSSTAPTAAGSYAIVATINDSNYQGSASGTLVIGKVTPSITWATPKAITYGTALSATQLNATSNVPGTFSYSPAATTVLGGGSQTLTATFSPTDAVDYASVIADVTLVVDQASQTITFKTIAAQTQGGTLSLNATASSGLAVSFTSATPAVCSVSGSTVTMLSGGTCTIQASQAGNANYLAANSVSQSFAVGGFTITASPGTETIKRGITAGFVLDVNSVNSFSGSVKISCSGGPANSICGEFPQTVRVSANRAALSLSGVLFPANTTPGTYTVTFTGTSGAATSQATATFTITK
jgi:sugar lactone lactonase YvrE